MSELEGLVDPVKDLKLDEQPDDTKSMEDLPPEVVTIILEHLTKNETRNNILAYRLVNSQWRDIIDPLLEQRIISGDFPVFPRMTVLCDTNGQDLLHVLQPFSVVPDDRNRFPFNSLVLDGWVGDDGETDRSNLLSSATRLQTMGDFMSTFGRYLTSFELQHVILPGMNSVITLLSSLTSLKHLSVQKVEFLDRVIEPNTIFKPLPPLPNLTTLVIKSDTRFLNRYVYVPGQLDDKCNILYVWLIVSYADQLLKLELETFQTLPAFQPRLQYYYSFRDGERLLIATTSDSAFRNLKKLKISRPDKYFLRFSDIPQLQQLSVTNIVDENNRDLLDMTPNNPEVLDMTEFISKCRNTLEKLRLDIDLHTLMGYEARLLLCIEGVLPPINRSSLPKIRHLEIHYSMLNDQGARDSSVYYSMITRFLAVFLDRLPALETLHFLRFPAIFISSARELETINGTVRAGKLSIVAVKTRLASLEHELYERNRIFQQQHAAIRDEVDDQDERDELENEVEQEMNNVTTTFNVRRAEILNELAALGVKKQEVVVEHFLESQGIWNTCPNLKLVTVSSRETPDGDVCLIRRPE